MWFTGDVGTGKTTLAMLISKAAMEADRTVAIYSLPRLLAMLRETYDDDAQYSPQRADRPAVRRSTCCTSTTSAPSRRSPWVLEQLYTIVNTRYEDGAGDPARPTEPVGHDGEAGTATGRELREQIGDRTVSRLYEICGDPLPMFGDDQRLRQQFDLPDAGRRGADAGPVRRRALGRATRPRYGRPRTP